MIEPERLKEVYFSHLPGGSLFYQRCILPPSVSTSSSASPDLSGHSAVPQPRAHSNCESQISVGTAGSQLRVQDVTQNVRMSWWESLEESNGHSLLARQ